MSVNENDAIRRAILIILDGYGVNTAGEKLQANTTSKPGEIACYRLRLHVSQQRT